MAKVSIVYLIAGSVLGEAVAPAQTPLSLVPAGAIWKYCDTGADLGTAWQAPTFDDSPWPIGPAKFGFGDGNEVTRLRATATNGELIVTCYFRHAFRRPEPFSATNLVVRLLRDDGGAVYLNGVEVFRSNLPGGPLNSATLAVNAVAGNDENRFYEAEVPLDRLLSGTNVLAVEVHQSSPYSGDLGFDLALVANAVPPTNQPPFVTITRPSPGERFTEAASIPLNASASDPDGSVQSVQFFVDGNLVGTDDTPPYAAIWSNATVGVHTFLARATDNAGANSPSYPVQVVVFEQTGTLSGLRRELYLDIPGRTLADLTNCARFPTQPDLIEHWSWFEVSNLGDNYGMRLRAYLLAPADGGYVFYLASDDQAALYLSTDKDPANRRQIAFEPDRRLPRQWFGGPSTNTSHISEPIPLQAGRVYYLEVLMKEGDGPDHLAVTWQQPGQPAPTNGAPPIPLDALRLYEANDVVTNPAVYFTVRASDREGEEPGDSMWDGMFDIVRHGPTNESVTVNLLAGGTAISGLDYVPLPPRVTIHAGAGLVMLRVLVLDDRLMEPPETVTLTVLPWESNPSGAAYRVGLPCEAVTTILDDDDPLIVQQPQSQTVTEKDPISFSVVALGTPPLRYQWFRYDEPISGATNATLTLMQVQMADRGDYWVEVANALRTNVSDEAELVVLPAGDSGSLDLTFVPRLTGPSRVEALAQQSDGRIIAGGVITNVGGVPCANLVRFSAAGVLDPAFAPRLQGSGEVLALAVQPDDKVLVGGVFTNVNGVERRALARLEANGALDLSFNPSTNLFFVVSSILVQSDGRMLVAGNAPTSGVCRQHLARFHPDGQIDASFLVVTTDCRNVFLRLALQPDGQVLLGGSFSTVNGVARSGVARLNPDGSLDLGFAPPTNVISVLALAVQPDGRILVGGTSVGPLGGNHALCIRLNADGSRDTSFQPKVGAQRVEAITLQSDGRILLGGDFSVVNQRTRGGLARLNADGTLDETFDTGTGVIGDDDESIRALLVQEDGRIVAGGDFTRYNGVLRNGLLRVHGTLSAPAILQHPASLAVFAGQDVTFRVSATGTSPRNYQWQENGHEIPGATNATLTLLRVQTNQAGLYSVVVSNVVGSVTSSSAVLTVLGPLTLAAAVDAVHGLCCLQLTGLGGHVPVLIEASTNLVNWETVYTHTVPAESCAFCDPMNRPVRFYRAVLPNINP